MKKTLFFVLAFLFSNVLWAQTIFVKPAEALKIIFEKSETITSEKKTLSPEQLSKLKEQLGYSIEKTEWTFFVAKTKGQVDGYGVIDNELGKTEPITFLTTFTPEGKVKEVEILVYREPYGSEVHQKSFLKQYINKSSQDYLKMGQDIQAISGATISSSSVTKGVKRGLAIWKVVYGRP